MTRTMLVALILLPLWIVAAPIDWAILESNDTLDLFMNGQAAGTLVQSAVVDDRSATVRIEHRIVVGTGATSAVDGSAPGMELTEKRTYGLDGMLQEARQEIKSASGSSAWHLYQKEKPGWDLTVKAGGAEQCVPVAKVTENLRATWSVLSGIRNKGIKAGAVFLDTAFDLTSAQTIYTAIRCVETPGKNNGFTWRFLCRNSVLGRDEAWLLDTLGVTRYQEMFPFVARKKNPSAPATKTETPFTLLSLIEALAVPAQRPAGAHEIIRLSFDGPMEPDSSVMRFYRSQNRSWLLSGVPQQCLNSGRGFSAAPEFSEFTVATTTMQSNDRRIRRVADSLCNGRNDRCDSIRACHEFVFCTIKKRYAPTFSNALETLDAGYGDCGEHAVLLGALLRSQGIPARVTLGLVYVNDKKGYYYHAWVMAESHGAWVFADPALGEFPAVKDRIPLVIDDTGKEVLQIAKVIGKIRVAYEKRKLRLGTDLKVEK
jgi:hypothetical protein